MDEDRRCTYKEMASEIESLGNSLNLHGVFRGESSPYSSPALKDWLFLLLILPQ